MPFNVSGTNTGGSRDRLEVGLSPRSVVASSTWAETTPTMSLKSPRTTGNANGHAR
jgi:hypothetical protein